MGIFVVNKLKFDASEEIQLDSLTLKRTGLSSSKAISKVWLEKNGIAVTNSASVGSDGLAVLNFKSNKDTISSSTEYELVVQTTDDNNYVGSEFAFELQSADSTAKNTTISGTTNTYRLSTYKVVVLEAREQNAGSYSYEIGGKQDFVIGEFTLTSDSNKDDRDIYVKSLTFKNKGSLDIADTFKNIKVFRDSKVVSNNVEVNGKDLTVTLDKDTITANKKAVYTIRAEVATLEEVWRNVQLQLQNTRDIVADEADTNFRANIHFGDLDKTTTPASYPKDKVWITLGSYTFNGGKVTFESDANFAQTIDAGIWATEVRIAKWKINVAEPIDLPTMVMRYGTDYTATTALTNKWEAVKRLTLVIGDKRYSADPAADGSITFSDISIKNSADVELLLNLSSSVKEGDSITFTNISSALMATTAWGTTYYQGTYTNNDEYFSWGDVAGLIQIADVNVKTPKFTISSDSISTQETVINNSSVKVLMKGKLTAKENDINVNDFKVTLNWSTLNAGENIQLYFKLNGKDFGSKTFNALWAYSFNSLWTLKVGETWDYEISVAPVVAHASEYYVDVEAAGTDTNGNAAKTSSETSATLKVNGIATIDVATTSASDRVASPTNNVVVYEGDLTVENGTTTLTGFELAIAANSGLSINGYKLNIDDDNLGNATTETTTGVVFTGLSKSLTAGVHRVQVKANVSSLTWDTNGTFSGTDYLFTVSSARVNSGAAITSTVKAYFAKGFFLLSKTSTDKSNLAVRLTNNSDKTIIITGVLLDKVSAAAADKLTVTVDGVEVTGTVADGVNSLASTISVAAGKSVEVRIIAAGETSNTTAYAALKGIVYDVRDGWETYHYQLDSSISSAAGNTWADFYASYSK